MAPTIPNRIDQKFKAALTALWQAKMYKDISLPAIVVCGDQSCGKSSVLEAMSTLRFPTKDGMCTRFVTRVEMEQHEDIRLVATITPSNHHSQQRQKELRDWRYETSDLAKFGDVITSAGQKMGSETEKGFLKDQLVIQLSGPDLPVFVFIDIPGLIQCTRKGQPASDVKYIEDLVTSYMSDPTKIVLTVVAANNDLELQGVLRHAMQIDPRGLRTIGVITKPDACEDRPSVREGALELLKNTGVGMYHWLLGWHVLKNRSDSQRDMTTEERDESESEYLARPPWDQVPAEFKGAENLSARLEARVFDAFISNVPNLRIQIKEKIEEATVDLDWLSSNTSSITSLRTELGAYLDRIVQSMNMRISNAGQNTKDIFGASLEDLAADLVNTIRSRGHFYQFDESCLIEQLRLPTAAARTEWDIPEPRPLDELHGFADSVVAGVGGEAGQMSDTMHKEIFRKQISHWNGILHQYIDMVKDLFDDQLSEVCSDVVPPTILEAFNDLVISTQVDLFADRLRGHIRDLLVPGKLKGTQAAAAASKAWKAQHEISEEERLKKAFGVANTNNVPATMKNPKRDFDTVLQRLKTLELNIGRFPAKQATALMQVLYIVSRQEEKSLCRLPHY